MTVDNTTDDNGEKNELLAVQWWRIFLTLTLLIL